MTKGEQVDQADPALSPQPMRWTPESVSRFWSLIRKSSLANSDFAVTAGPRLAEVIAGLIAPKGRVLDFGCGGGHLVSALKARGLDVVGYEPSADVTDPIVTTKRPEGPFQTIIVSEVYEHVLEADLQAALAYWEDALHPGGRLLLTVPNEERLETNMCICPNCATYFHRWQHMRSVSQRTLEEIFTRERGWAVSHVGRYDFSNDCDAFTALKRYKRYAPVMRERIRLAMEESLQAAVDAGQKAKEEGGDTSQARKKGAAKTLDTLTNAAFTIVDDMIHGGTLTDLGVDYSEGRGNVLIFVVERAMDNKTDEAKDRADAAADSSSSTTAEG